MAASMMSWRAALREFDSIISLTRDRILLASTAFFYLIQAISISNATTIASSSSSFFFASSMTVPENSVYQTFVIKHTWPGYLS